MDFKKTLIVFYSGQFTVGCSIHYNIQMRSQFFITPTIDTVIKESVDIINVCRPMISYDTEDIRAIAKEADNIILLEGQAKSSYRVSDAIEDAIIKICDVAKKFDFSLRTKY